MSEQQRYHVYAVAFDTQEGTEGDRVDFRNWLDQMETIKGVHLLGHDTTATWPTYRIKGAPKVE